MYGLCRLIYFSLMLPGLMLISSPCVADPTQNLQDIFLQALAHDPAWAAARNSHVAMQEISVQGRALTLPTVTAGANLGHSNSDATFKGTIPLFAYRGEQSFDSYGYNLNIIHPLYRRENNVQYAQSQTQVAQADDQLEAAHQNLMLQVANAYFDVLLAQDKIDLILAQKAAIAKQLEQAKTNFDVGTATITDVNEAQARFDLTTAQEIAAINELEVKKRSIQAITTVVPGRLATAKANIQVARPNPDDMESWVALAAENNIALKVQQHSLKIATQEIEKAHARNLPTVDVVGSYSDNHANGGVNPMNYPADERLLSIGLQVQLPLYQGGAITSKEREAVANQQKAQDELEGVRRQAELQARQAYLNVGSTMAQVKAYEQALTSSKSQLDSTHLGYEVGVRTSVDVLNAQQQFYSAQRDLLQARYAYLLSLLQLRAAAGLLNDNDMTEINNMLEGS
jgi:outer membrane protein